MEERPLRTVALATVGCKLNQYETEGMAELFESRGFSIVPFDRDADVYVVNTCTVTGRSDYRSRQMLRRAARRRRDALIVATGCYAQRDPNALQAMPEVGLVVGQTAKHEIADLVAGALAGRPESEAGTTVVVRPHDGSSFQALDIRAFRGYTRAFLKIQDGCDRRCAYCAVPDARGPARSRPFADVVRQAETLAANGYREIVLTGVHIGTYADGDLRLPDVIDAVAALDDVVRVRLGSVEPNELTPELAARFVAGRKLANHLHVPLESGSDHVLRRMRRGYTAAEYAEAVRRVTDHDPSCGLGADVMVGFPGETDEDFADTVQLIESLPFTYLHVFSFSPRRGTEAAAMTDTVPGIEKKRRSRELRGLGARKSLAFRRRLVGSRLRVLVERGSDGGDGVVSGLAGNYVRVELAGGPELENRFVDAVVRGADKTRTWGEAVPGTVG